MSANFIVLGGPKDLVPDGTNPMKDYTYWRDQLVAEKGEQFYEDYMNGFIDIDGNPTEESIRAEGEAAAYFEAWDRYYGSNSLC